MKTILNPLKTEWSDLCTRPAVSATEMNELVANIFQTISVLGDAGVRGYTKQFDKVEINEFKCTESEISNGVNSVDEALKAAIQLAAKNIRTFHEKQVTQSEVIETTPGVNCWREARPIEKVGIYIPGGSAPLFSTVLMLGIPAILAGCKQIILCTPPNKEGTINPAILFTAQLIGITEIYKVGGIQAIAAMTEGTESIPKVDKLFGPGNQFVTAAKEYALTKGVAIDMPAGPSEVLIIADEQSNSSFIAADLLSQAEHGADSQVFLLSNNEQTVALVNDELVSQLNQLSRQDIAAKALENSLAIVLPNISSCVEFSNQYAPEHLILALEKPSDFTAQITNAGSVFMGRWSCESAGDYASGTNHTLPTNGYARNYSGVSLDSFVKKITFQELSKDGIRNIGPAIELMAAAEGLDAHKNAVTIRLKAIQND